jgi:hypothetical protein
MNPSLISRIKEIENFAPMPMTVAELMRWLSMSMIFNSIGEEVIDESGRHDEPYGQGIYGYSEPEWTWFHENEARAMESFAVLEQRRTKN